MTDLRRECAVLDRLVTDIARLASANVVASVVAHLNGLPGAMDEGRSTAWDEICVQVQSGESLEWESYRLTLEQAARGAIFQLATAMQQALSLQTADGMEWIDVGRDDEVPVYEDAVVQHVVVEVLALAGSYTSAAMGNCQSGGMADDAE
ncbi:hypothetical protein [Lysobacter sp. HA18]